MNKKTKSEKIADDIISVLTEKKVECYIWHKATTGSVYIRFEDCRIGSVRIADHAGRSKLKYKYNILIGSVDRPKWIKDDGAWRCYSGDKCYLDLCALIIQQAEKVKSYSAPKLSYGIPSFKR